MIGVESGVVDKMRIPGTEAVERVAGLGIAGSSSIGGHAKSSVDQAVEADDRQQTEERDRDIAASMASSTDPKEPSLYSSVEADG